MVTSNPVFSTYIFACVDEADAQYLVSVLEETRPEYVFRADGEYLYVRDDQGWLSSEDRLYLAALVEGMELLLKHERAK